MLFLVSFNHFLVSFQLYKIVYWDGYSCEIYEFLCFFCPESAIKQRLVSRNVSARLVIRNHLSQSNGSIELKLSMK